MIHNFLFFPLQRNICLQVVLYISTSVWVLHTQTNGQNNAFLTFLMAKSFEKEKFASEFNKNGFLKFAPKRWLSVLFQIKQVFS